MNRPRRQVLALLVALFATFSVAAAVAHASAYTKVLSTYEKTGTVPACSFSSVELQNALKGVDTYGAQYFQDFTNAIQTALAQRASGQCVSAKRVGPPGLSAAPNARSVAAPGSVTTATGAGLPAPIVLLGALMLMLALLAAAMLASRLRGWDPAWAVAWRHMWAEAGYRMGGTWAEFRDWLHSA